MGGCDLRRSLFLTPQALPVVFSGSQMLQFEAWSSFQDFELLSAIFPLRSLMLSQPWATLGFALFSLHGRAHSAFSRFLRPDALVLVSGCFWSTSWLQSVCGGASAYVARDQEVHSPTLNACLVSPMEHAETSPQPGTLSLNGARTGRVRYTLGLS